MHKFHTLTIKDVVKETPNAVSVHFDLPSHLKEDFTFQSGQYITLKTTLDGKEIRRAYSLCSTPHSGELSVVIKAVKNGAFSPYANEKFKAGDVLEVLPPEGKFVLTSNASNANNYVAFVAGSGITPVMAILKTVLEKEPLSTFLLVYGNKSPEETIFFDQLKTLKYQYPERFFLEFAYSESTEEDARFGRIDAGMVNFFIKNKYGHLNFHSFYICGPEEMIAAVSDTLKSNGTAENRIFFELFSTSDNSEIPENADGTTTVTILLDDETTTFTMPQTKAVLDAALEEGLDPPYSCQGGICSTCIARITEGRAEMRKNQILTDSEVADGLILTCQAHPVTPVLKVDYDDV